MALETAVCETLASLLSTQCIVITPTLTLKPNPNPKFIKAFYYHGLTLTQAWMNNRMTRKMWDEITYLFPNFNGETIEV